MRKFRRISRERAEATRLELIEAAVDLDETAMEAYLEGNMPDEATLKRLIRKAVLVSAFFPVLAGSAFKNKGVQTLLDAVVDYLPSPVDVPPTKGIDVKTGEEIVRLASDDEPLAMLAFKIIEDPFGTSHVCAGLFRPRAEGGRASELHKGEEGAHRPHGADARRIRARRSRRPLRATSSLSSA